jgi:transposase
VYEAVAVELAGMPEVASLRRVCLGGQIIVSFGARLVFRYEDDDTAMRNLAIVALTDAEVEGLEVAGVFGLSAPYISRIRGEARRSGAEGLVKRRGRPPKLSDRQVATARRLAAGGTTHQEIATRYGVARSVISELLAKFGPAPVQVSLPENNDEAPVDEATVDVTKDADTSITDVVANEGTGHDAHGEDARAVEHPGAGLARIAAGLHPTRYAGAALIYPYLDLVDAEGIFSTLSGARSRRYDDLSVLASAVMGFALGIDTVEGAKHLRRNDAGVVVGVSAIPELRTLRARLSALADGGDPLALQRSFARATLTADPPTSPIYYVDDHFVAYAGARPLAKGWNTKRRHAQKGRDDTHICDERGRAVVFASSEPSGLSATMGSVLSQLRQVLGPDQRVLLGFDRGGSYPKAFSACRAENMDWITYRRGKLAPVSAPVRRSWARRDGRRVVLHLADEEIDVTGYGRARQLTLYEHGQAILQVLTSDMDASGAALLLWLRGRWSIENFFKYASEHNGIDSISSYLMDQGPDESTVANPKRKAARADVAAAESALAGSERALAQLLCDPATGVEETNGQVARLQHAVEAAAAALAVARGALKGIPAKVSARELDPRAERAKLRLERRGLQMVCRLLAFNAEAWLAEHFNAYLGDLDEYRAIMRNLLHLGGTFTYEANSITVTLDRPDSPRVAHALELLSQELNTHSARLLGDRRALSYQVAEAGQN